MWGLLVIRPKSCVVCGRRTDDGASRCLAHKQGGTRPRPCVVCGRQTIGNYCPDHDPAEEAVRVARNPYRLAYRDPVYAKNRLLRFERVRGLCEVCGAGPLKSGEWESDHVVELRDGGTNTFDNLRILCKPCHKTRTAQARRNRRGNAQK